ILKDKLKWLAVTEDQLSSTVFQHKQVKYPLLDQSIRLWVEQITNSEVILTELMIKKKVIVFAKALGLSDDTLKFSNEWIHKFKQRNNLRNFKLYREANSAPLSSLLEYREKLHELIE
ncbi:21329_t:CDS:1, partial [Racocetra persica]